MLSILNAFIKRPSIISVIAILAALTVWQLLVWCLNIPDYIVSSPLAIAQYFQEHFSMILSNTAITLLEAVAGIIFATLAAIIIGAIALRSMILAKATYSILLTLQLIPLLAVAPLVIVWLGFGIDGKIFIVFIFGLFPILVAFLHGCLNVDPSIMALFKCLGVSKTRLFFYVILPQGAAELFTGLKLAVTYCVGSAVAAEYLGGAGGLGILITRALSSFNTAGVYCASLVVILATLTLYGIITWLEKRCLRWRH